MGGLPMSSSLAGFLVFMRGVHQHAIRAVGSELSAAPAAAVVVVLDFTAPLSPAPTPLWEEPIYLGICGSLAVPFQASGPSFPFVPFLLSHPGLPPRLVFLPAYP